MEMIKRDLQYDVFINHRGTDVKKGLASIIYNLFKIKDCRLQVFLDQKEIRCGVDVSTAIEEAIKSSHVHIAIFSERYAESKWCLDELVSILGSKRKVIPVFYDVEPTALRYINSGCYQKAFEKHRRRVTVEKTEKWKKALLDASLLKGELCNTKEHDLWDFSQKIVDIVLKEFEQESLAVTKEQAAKDFPIGASELDGFQFIKEFITEEFALAHGPDEDRLDLSVLLQAVEDRADLRDLFEADEYGPAVSELFEADEDGATLSELLEADQKDGPTLSELTTEADEDGPAVSELCETDKDRPALSELFKPAEDKPAEKDRSSISELFRAARGGLALTDTSEDGPAVNDSSETESESDEEK